MLIPGMYQISGSGNIRNPANEIRQNFKTLSNPTSSENIKDGFLFKKDYFIPFIFL